MAESFLLSTLNKFYLDFISGNKIATNYLPNIKPGDSQLFTDTLPSVSPIHTAVKKLLAEDNDDLGSAAARLSLKNLESENTYFIVTGQQLGLFGSPIYTIYKIITAIKLASYLNQQYPIYNFIPLFWMETEDHDFQEVNVCGIWGKNNEPFLLKYQGKDEERLSIRHYVLEKQIRQILEQVKDNSIMTEYSDDLLKLLRTIYMPDQSWPSASRTFLKEIFTGISLFWTFSLATSNATSARSKPITSMLGIFLENSMASRPVAVPISRTFPSFICHFFTIETKVLDVFRIHLSYLLAVSISSKTPHSSAFLFIKVFLHLISIT